MTAKRRSGLFTSSGDEALAEQAAHWIVSLTADDAAERERARQGFEAWKRADPRHAAAAFTMEALVGQVQSLREHADGELRPARAALQAAFPPERKRTRIRRLGAALGVALALAVPAVLALQAWPPSHLAADLRGTTGTWQTRTLPDGTRLTMKGATAVDLHYDAQRRTVELLGGEILVDVAKDPARPFVVDTRDGRIRALGTRFVVERTADSTVLTVLESRVSVQAASQRAAGSEDATPVQAGQRLRITPEGLGQVEEIDARSVSDAWQFHQAVFNDRPLPEVLDALGRQRPGHLHYDRAQIDHIRVSAVLPLDDTDRALQLLVANFPQLRVRTLTPYIVWVDAPASR